MLCFRKFPVAKKFKDKRGEYQNFASKKLCFTVTKNFVGEPLSVSLIPGIGKVFASYGHVKVFRRFFFLSQNRKNLQGILLCCVSENFR